MIHALNDPGYGPRFCGLSAFPRPPSALYNRAMTYHALAGFLEDLAQAGQLARVAAAVDPALEVAEITGRVVKVGGPALLFGNVKGHPFPIVTNLLGTDARICRALGVKALVDLREQIAALVHPAGPEGWFERMTAGPSRASLRKLAPRSVKTGPCQQVVGLGRDVDLGELPVLQSWPEEQGGTITAGQVFTADVDSGQPVVGRYDVRVFDRNRLLACWHAHDDPARLLVGYRRRNAQMPLALVLGGDPAGLLAAMAPLPPEADAVCVAGLLRDKPLDMVKCRTVNLEAPADAEIVIEGYVDPAEPPVDAGPRGTPNGYYEPSCPAPVIHVTAMTRRANPVYPAIVPALPPDESCAIARALHQIFLPLVRLAIPELADYDLPAFGAARHWAFVAIRKTYAGQARKVAHAVWGLRQLMFAKLLVIVDESVDVHDPDQVWSAVTAHVDAAGDIFFQQGPRDPRDPATPPGTLAYKAAVDATKKLPGEYQGERPGPTVMTDDVRRLVSGRWTEYGLGPGQGE